MIFKNATILDENFDVRKGVNLRVEGNIISYIGDDMPEASPDEEMLDCSKRLIMPGFYNAHGHSPMCLMRGYGENLNLQDWLFNRIFPFEAQLTSDAVYWATMLTMAESLQYGIVSTSDMYYFCDDMARAVEESGAKANISRAISKMDESPFFEFKAIREMQNLVKSIHGAANGRVKMDSSLHAEYTNNEGTIRNLAEFTKELGLIMHVHVSETKTEHEECKERHEGRTPTRYLADCGLFDVPALAAHCVWVEDEDRDILSEKGVTVATNPASNLKLASGVCNVKALMDKGVRVAIGTDSVASNNNLSMFEEMKTMSLLAKVASNDPTVLTPKEAITMATRHGALAQGREDCGLIKEGFKADLVLIKLDSPNMNPVYNMLNNLVLAATDMDIAMTMVDGKVLYRDGEFTTIDLERVIRGVEESVKDILGRL